MAQLTNQDLHFVVRRLPKDVARLIKDRGLILAGGFIRELIARGEVKDIDLFGKSREQLGKAAEELAKLRPGTKTHYSENATTLLTSGSLPIQFIKRWVFETPDDCRASFDFTVCQAAIWYDQQTCSWRSVTHEAFYSDLAARRLTYTSPVRNEEAGGSALRMVKFLARGYTVQVDSIGSAMARLFAAVRTSRVDTTDEEAVAYNLTGLLREVDPLLAMDGHNALNDDETFGE